MAAGDAYHDLFARHRSVTVSSLWPWQSEVLSAYAGVTGDAAIELPTGTGKTLLGLLTGEHFRESEGAAVAYLAGNKQLAQQVERQARDLGFPVVRFQGSKDSWSSRDVRAFNFGEAIGVMNYWNYFNASPGVEPAGMLILDDVHLLEGPLRDLFTVSIGRGDPLSNEILKRIIARCPYYGLVEDLLNNIEQMGAPEMLVFPDSAELADEVRDLLDGRLADGSEAWWGWQRIRDRLEVCCWLVSARGVTLTPYIPPAQTMPHFEQPSRRLYLSATVGSVDDLRRRLGTPPLTKLTASVQPRQGERLVMVRDSTDLLAATELVDVLRPFLSRQQKALWLCARRDTAQAFELALELATLPGQVRRLEGDNGADEPFSAEAAGHLVAAGRYDGMDFSGEACRVEIVPEVPVATSDLEEFVSAYLRDAPFAQARFAQRVAQALGRCNRSEDDRAVYVLTDPEFVGRFSRRRTLDALPDDVRADVYAALERSDRGFDAGLDEADRFLDGEDLQPSQPPTRAQVTPGPSTAADEVDGMLALWREDYGRAADLFDRVAAGLAQAREHRAFWLAMRALALQLAGGYGDQAAATEAVAALRAAATAGAVSTFFTRLRLAHSRLEGAEAVAPPSDRHDGLFVAWDRLIDRHGAQGPRFDRWSAQLLEDLRSPDHDRVVRGVVQVGGDLLGLAAEARKATSGEEDASWQLAGPNRTLAFEVKLAPTTRRVVNDDVEQAEGAARALESDRGHGVRGLLVTPHDTVDPTAEARLERVRLLKREVFVQQVEQLLALAREYRRGWTDDAATRAARRNVVEADLPAVDWLWQAIEGSSVWVESATLKPVGRLTTAA
jgi:RAD3-like DEAD/DEAH box helicase